MALAKLRPSGGSTIVTMPASIMELAEKDGLTAEASLEVDYDPEAGVITMRRPRRRPRYTMAELLAQSEPNAPLSDEEKEWLSDAPTGREAI